MFVLSARSVVLVFQKDQFLASSCVCVIECMYVNSSAVDFITSVLRY